MQRPVPINFAIQSVTRTLESSVGRLWIVTVFAIAMAWVEAAVVFYLRSMINRIEPYQANPLPIVGGFATAELVREAATLVMLLTVGLLAGKTWRSRIGYSAVAFGVWDIFYYLFLKVMCDWPHSVMDWDILFLLPLPWWGPVLAPCLIAGLMIAWGTLATLTKDGSSSKALIATSWGLAVLGMAIALAVFMMDSLKVAHEGGTALRNMLPETFDWPLFGFSLLLMAMPVLNQVRELITGRTRNSTSLIGAKP